MKRWKKEKEGGGVHKQEKKEKKKYGIFGREVERKTKEKEKEMNSSMLRKRMKKESPLAKRKGSGDTAKNLGRGGELLS